MSDDRLIHGAELDEAIGNALGPNALEAIICESALRARVKSTIDGQLEWIHDPERLAEAKRELMGAGAAFDDDTALLLSIRAGIGGTFTHGIAVGLELARMREAKA